MWSFASIEVGFVCRYVVGSPVVRYTSKVVWWIIDSTLSRVSLLIKPLPHWSNNTRTTMISCLVGGTQILYVLWWCLVGTSRTVRSESISCDICNVLIIHGMDPGGQWVALCKIGISGDQTAFQSDAVLALDGAWGKCNNRPIVLPASWVVTP